MRNTELDPVYQQDVGKDCDVILVGNVMAPQEDTSRCLSRDSQPLVSSTTKYPGVFFCFMLLNTALLNWEPCKKRCLDSWLDFFTHTSVSFV